jgi:hypothetical protein
MVRQIGQMDLSGPYDIRIQKGTSLPESKVARTQTILDLKESFPNLFPDEIAADVLELSQDTKFRTIATVSVNDAELENEQIMNDEQVVEPKEWEDHIIHYRIHLLEMRSSSFQNAPIKKQQAFIQHITTTEFLMWERSQKNALFAQML